MQKIRIDFDNPGLPQHISAVENDSQSRFFQATLYENGKAYTAPEGAAYSIMYRGFGPQNQGWYDTINDGAGKRSACAVSGNVVTCEIARQALQVPGHVSIVLCVTTGKGYMLKSWPIECDCKNDRYDSTAEIESFFYITQVSNADWTQAIQAVEELKNTIDPTLSVSGKAADAAKVGEALAEETDRAKGVENQLKSDIDKEQKNNVRYFIENVIKSVSFKSNRVRWYNTGVIDWHETYSMSDLFTCKPNNLYDLVTTGNPHICYFDIDKNYISGTISKSFITPQNCVYLCVSIEGNVVDDLVLKSKTNETLDMLIGFNGELNDSATTKDDFFLMYNTGIETYNGEYCYTLSYIPVGAKSKIGLNISGCHTCFYDKDKKYISGSVMSGFVTPTKCAYIRVSFKKALKSKIKIYKTNEQFVLLGKGGFSDFDNALNCARALNLPIKILGGNHDIGFYSGSGLYCDVSIYGVGMPTLYANKDSFDVNFSPINMANNKDVIIDGVKIVATNCRYAIHDEMGSNGENDFYKHTIRNCIIEQNTDIQSSFTYPRCIGVGMGNNGQILIENCILKSNVPEEIDAHTGYNGQIKDCTVIIKDCVMETGTVSATSVDIGDNFKDTVIVTNCLVNAIPFINSSTKDNLKFIQYNNKVIE